MSTRVPICLFALACLPALTSRAAPLPPPLVGVWTPPASSYTPDEVSGMPDVLLLKAGTKLPVFLKTPMDGKWTAEYGVIDEHGNYQAPPYIPVGGDDRITFTHGDNSRVPAFTPGQPLPPPEPLPADYQKFELTVRIVPNPAIPGSSETPYMVMPSANSAEDTTERRRLADGQPIVFPKQFPLPAAKFLFTLGVLKPGEMLPALITLTRTQPTVLNRSKDAYILPASNLFGSHTDGLQVRVKAVSFVPQRAKELPQLAGSPDTDPDPRMGTRPDVREAIKKWQASQAKKTEL